MRDIAETDLDLFGLWPPTGERKVAQPEAKPGAMAPERLGRAVERVILELKSATMPSPLEEYRLLLNELTREMREQFALFRALREKAEAAIEDGDEAAGKLARADAKAATDAMSLIVRTLEKVDSLQRQLARDRAEAEEREAEDADHDAIAREFDRVIEARATEIAEQRLRDWRERHEGAATTTYGAGEPGAAAQARGP